MVRLVENSKAHALTMLANEIEGESILKWELVPTHLVNLLKCIRSKQLISSSKKEILLSKSIFY